VSRDDCQRLANIDDAGPASDAKRDAILFRFVVIGEAIKGLSPAARERDHADLLRRFAGLRDILTHEYFRIDLEIVEEIVNERLPLLHELIDDLLK